MAISSIRLITRTGISNRETGLENLSSIDLARKVTLLLEIIMNDSWCMNILFISARRLNSFNIQRIFFDIKGTEAYVSSVILVDADCRDVR